MHQERNNLGIVLAVVAVVVGIFFLLPRVEERLAPQPEQAWVAIEAEGSGVARVGRVELDAGTPFTLHAVLEAKDRDGQSVFYTEASALELHGETIPQAALKAWDRPRPPKILWFTVEGAVRLREVGSVDQVRRFQPQEVYRPEWPNAWSIPGELEASRVAAEDRPFRRDEQAFGTQRFHVRIEVYEDEKALLPEKRFKSWGAEALPERVGEFPTVTASLPGLLGPATSVFGLSQLEPETAEPELVAALEELTDQRLAFSRLAILVETMAAAGGEGVKLSGRPLELAAEVPWGEEVHAGDLLQVAERVVLLFEDRGVTGVLDPEDLCLDFARGAAIRSLDQVFVGEGDVSWVPLGGREGTTP